MIVAEKVSRIFDHPRKREYERGRKQVLDQVTFHIPKGEIVGITGINGSGKTTLMKMMAGILEPTDGSLFVLGVNPVLNQRRIAKDVILILAAPALISTSMIVSENLEMMGMMYGVRRREYETRYQTLSEVLGLEQIQAHPISHLSLGELRRVELAMALLVQPRLLLLDEVFVGMDAVYKKRAMDYLKWLKQTYRTTIVMTAHQSQDLERICNRILVLSQGHMLYYGSLDQLERIYASRAYITIRLKQQIPDLGDLAVESYEITNSEMTIWYQRNHISTKIILQHILKQCEAGDICIREQGLEQALLRTQGGIWDE